MLRKLLNTTILIRGFNMKSARNGFKTALFFTGVLALMRVLIYTGSLYQGGAR